VRVREYLGRYVKSSTSAGGGFSMEIIKKEEHKNPADYLIQNGAVVLGEIISGVIGTMGIPIISNGYLMYKQKKMERNILMFLTELLKRAEHLEETLSGLESDKLNYIKNELLPLTFDYVVDEKQEEKIIYYINGLKNLVISRLSILETNPFINPDNLLIMYFDILRRATAFDLLILKEIHSLQDRETDEKPQEINKDDLREITVKYSVNKLEDLGLIYKGILIGEMSGKNEFSAVLEKVRMTAVGEKFVQFVFE